MPLVDFLVKLVAIAGIVITVITYRKNTRLERAKWLNGLYEKFYEKDTYKEIRLIIDYETPTYDDLIEAIKADTKPELQEKLVDYLNFFEFIATLNKTRQLNIEEINLVFGYYIQIIDKNIVITDFVKKHGFQNLTDLIRHIKLLRQV